MPIKHTQTHPNTRLNQTITLYRDMYPVHFVVCVPSGLNRGRDGHQVVNRHIYTWSLSSSDKYLFFLGQAVALGKVFNFLRGLRKTCPGIWEHLRAEPESSPPNAYAGCNHFFPPTAATLSPSQPCCAPPTQA